MPLSGTRDIAPLIAGSAVMQDFKTEPWTLAGVSILQVLYELRQDAIVSLIPPSLGPTIPPTLLFTAIHAPESSVGPFTLAEARVGCRAGARPRSFLARGYVDSERAADELARRWGYPLKVADVRLKAGYDRAMVTVTAGGHEILLTGLQNPEAISGSDIQWLPNMHLARSRRDGEEIARLIQVDPDFTYHKADRGQPFIETFDAAAWLLDGADPWWPVSASHVSADITMPHIRYVLDPTKPAISGVERVG
jgi:hypothetical protein